MLPHLIEDLRKTRTGYPGADHPATLATRHQLALILSDLGVSDDAEKELGKRQGTAHDPRRVTLS